MSEEEKINKPRFITGEVVGQEGIVIPEAGKKEKDDKDKEDEADSR